MNRRHRVLMASLQRRGNPYDGGFRSGGLITQGGRYYFTTPSVRLFGTDVSEAGTGNIYAAEGSELPAIAATQSFISSVQARLVKRRWCGFPRCR